VVGAAGVYEARCRRCFEPFVETPPEQMDLPVSVGSSTTVATAAARGIEVRSPRAVTAD